MQTPPAETSPANPWIVLACSAIAVLMATLDASCVNVAMPAIARGYGVPVASVSWISIIYFLVITTLLLTVGRLSDLTRRSTVFSWGMGLFAVASGLCAMSPSLETLIAARALQALGGAMIMANSPALIASAFPGNQRGRALGTITLVSTMGSSLGPTIGGILTGTVGWHAMFWINVPIGLAGTILGLRVLKAVPQAPSASNVFDGIGALLSALSLLALLLAMREGAQLSRGLTLGLAALGLIGLFGFMAYEGRHPAPLLQPRLFLRRAFASATGASFLSFCARAGFFFLVPFFLQRAQGYSAAVSGFMMTSFPLAVSLVAPVTGALSDRLGTRGLTVFGQVLAALSLGWMMTLHADSNLLMVLAPQVTLGLATAFFTPANNNAMLSAVDPDELGMASGMLAVMRNLGLTVGTGIASLVLSLYPDFMGGFRAALGVAALLALASALVASVRAKGGTFAPPVVS